jgi:AAA domain
MSNLNGLADFRLMTQFLNGSIIEDTTANAEAAGGGHDLIAGTAWLFAREELDQQLDYLFIDEAGQVSLANTIAMGVCAKNVILVGDQMQLSQPLKGSHPGRSGLSALEYLLGDAIGSRLVSVSGTGFQDECRGRCVDRRHARTRGRDSPSRRKHIHDLLEAGEKPRAATEPIFTHPKGANR